MSYDPISVRVLRSILKNPRRPVEIAAHLGEDMREVFTALVTLTAWGYCEQMGECYWTRDADKVREFCDANRHRSKPRERRIEALNQRIVSASTTRAQITGPNSIFQLAAEAA